MKANETTMKKCFYQLPLMICNRFNILLQERWAVVTMNQHERLFNNGMKQRLFHSTKSGVRDLILFNYYTNEVMRELAI